MTCVVPHSICMSTVPWSPWSTDTRSFFPMIHLNFRWHGRPAGFWLSGWGNRSVEERWWRHNMCHSHSQEMLGYMICFTFAPRNFLSRSTTWNATCEVGGIKRLPILLRVVLAWVFIQYFIMLYCCTVSTCWVHSPSSVVYATLFPATSVHTGGGMETGMQLEMPPLLSQTLWRKGSHKLEKLTCLNPMVKPSCRLLWWGKVKRIWDVKATLHFFGLRLFRGYRLVLLYTLDGGCDTSILTNYMVKHGQVMQAFKSCEWRPKKNSDCRVEVCHDLRWLRYIWNYGF